MRRQRSKMTYAEFDRLRDTMLKCKPYCLMGYHEQLCTCVFHFIDWTLKGISHCLHQRFVTYLAMARLG